MLIVCNNNGVDWNVNELDKESNESHDGKSNPDDSGGLLELWPVWFAASPDKCDGIHGELL